MLVPAILYKQEIETQFQKNFYTTDMMYEQGYLGSYTPEISDSSDGDRYEFAIVNSKEELIGYLAYSVDWYSSVAHRFGLFSFDKGNPLVGKAVFEEMNKLLKEYRLHRLEWRMVGGNPAKRGYDRFCKAHNGKVLEMTDVFKDRYGEYHNIYIYEIINEEVK